MEKSVKSVTPPSQIPVLTLAYLGDAVLELLVRDRLVSSGITQPKHLNIASREYVTLESQSNAVERILPYLSEEETAMFKRGRNAKPHTTPKHGDKIQYLRATGLEVLFGYLYKCGRSERLEELFRLAFPSESEKEPSEDESDARDNSAKE